MKKNILLFPKNNSEFTNELRLKVKEYFALNGKTSHGNTSIVLKSIVMILLYLIPYLIMISGIANSIPVILICWILMGIGMAGTGMVLMHDANHGSFSKNKRINVFLGKSLYLLGGFPPNWKYQHNTLHHGYTNIDGHDEDIAPAGILRFSPHQPLHKIHKYQYLYAWFFYSLMTLSWVTMKDFSRLNNYRKTAAPLSNTKSYRRLMSELIISKILYYTFLLIIPLIVIPIGWYWIAAGFLAMHLVGGLILSTIFQTAHVVPTSEYPLPDETGHTKNNWTIHQLLTTADYSPRNKVFSWLIGGLNYQIEHHLFPNVSHVHYKKLASIVKTTAGKYNLPYHVQGSFLRAVSNHAVMLKSLGRL